MALLSAAQLAVMRNAVAQVLPDTCSIQRYTSAPDGAGGQTETWSTVHTAVACRVTAYSGRKGGVEDQIRQRFDSVLWWRVTLPVGTDVTVKDRIGFGAHTFEVRSVETGRSFEVECHADCEEIS
jgi:head-tail adaptor